jgi:hypothetical protein
VPGKIGNQSYCMDENVIVPHIVNHDVCERIHGFIYFVTGLLLEIIRKYKHFNSMTKLDVTYFVIYSMHVFG